MTAWWYRTTHYTIFQLLQHFRLANCLQRFQDFHPKRKPNKLPTTVRFLEDGVERGREFVVKSVVKVPKIQERLSQAQMQRRKCKCETILTIVKMQMALTVEKLI